MRFFSWKENLLGLFVAYLAMFAGLSSTHAQIPVVPNWSEDEAEHTGFFDPVLGQIRRDTFFAAAGYLGSLFRPSYPGETIRVKVSFKPLNGSMIGIGGPIGLTSSDTFTSSNPKVKAHTDYSFALANHLSGTNLNSGDLVEVTFNSDADVVWSYSTIDTPPPESIRESLYTTMIHEIAHGLGFIDGMDPKTASYSYGNLLPTAYDRYLVKGELTKIPLASMTDAERFAAMTSNDLYWSGPLAAAANEGRMVKLYAPKRYESGESVSHLDPAVFDAQGSIMLPKVSVTTKVALTLSPVELGILFDIGFTPAGQVSRPILSIAGRGEAITISFATQVGVAYRLRSTTSPMTPLLYWETHPAAVTGDGKMQSITDAAGKTGRFYLVEALP